MSSPPPASSPDLLARILLTVSLVLLVALCLLLVLFGRHALVLADGVRSYQARAYAEAHPPLPEGAALLHDQTFTEAVARFPLRVPELLARRAVARLAGGDPAGACRDFGEATLALAPQRLATEDRLRHAEALLANQQPAAAEALLWGLDLRELDAISRQRALALLAGRGRPSATVE